MKYSALIHRETGRRSIRINKTGELVWEDESPVEYAKLRKRAMANSFRAAKDQIMRDCGLTKVYGAVSGKVYWE
jgi:hypothetical protein